MFTNCRIPPSRVLSTVGFIVVWGGGGGVGLCPSGRRPRAFLGDPGACSPEIFCSEYALRFNLVNFEKILRNVTVCTLTSSRLDDFSDMATYVVITIFFWGECSFLGEASIPQLP